MVVSDSSGEGSIRPPVPLMRSQTGLLADSGSVSTPADGEKQHSRCAAKRRALSEVPVNRSARNGGDKNDAELQKRLLLGKVQRVRRQDSDLTYVHLQKQKKRLIYKDDDDDEKTKPTAATGSWEDLDSEELNDVCMVAEYTNDIFAYLYERELETIPAFNYLTEQQAPYPLRPSMRAILVDWLVEVHEKFQCYPETLFLAINIMDRFLCKTKVALNKLQLLAVTSLFIAAKFEEINLPKLDDYAYITDGAASKNDITAAEMFILTTLEFNLAWPNPMNFLRRISKADGYDLETRNIAKMLLEYAVCSHRFVNLKPSLTSAMAMYIARRITNRNKVFWDNTFNHYSGGIDALHDKDFQKFCSLLVQEVACPTTKLDSLNLKFKKSRNGGLYCKVFDWCTDQAQSNFDNLFP